MPPKAAPTTDATYTALLAWLDERIRAQSTVLMTEANAASYAWNRRELSELLDLSDKVRRHTLNA